MICAAYGKNAVSYTNVKDGIKNFAEDFSLENEPRTERPQNIETDELQALLDKLINSTQAEKEFAEQLGVTQQAIFVCLHTTGKVQKEGKWISHELSEYNKNRRRDTCFQSSGKKGLLHKIIIGNER